MASCGMFRFYTNLVKQTLIFFIIIVKSWMMWILWGEPAIKEKLLKFDSSKRFELF